MKTFAYADPPYPGQSWRLYGYHGHPDYRGEVDHAELIERLERDYPDGWALSTSTAALPEVLALCPPGEPSQKNKGRVLDGTGVRVMAWAKKTSPWRPVGIQYGWEPVIIRSRRPKGGFVADWHISSPHDPLNMLGQLDADRPDWGGKFHGVKPYSFCAWIFDALGAGPDDVLHDLFPGSGAVGRAWESWRNQLTIGGAA